MSALPWLQHTGTCSFQTHILALDAMHALLYSCGSPHRTNSVLYVCTVHTSCQGLGLWSSLLPADRDLTHMRRAAAEQELHYRPLAAPQHNASGRTVYEERQPSFVPGTQCSARPSAPCWAGPFPRGNSRGAVIKRMAQSETRPTTLHTQNIPCAVMCDHIGEGTWRLRERAEMTGAERSRTFHALFRVSSLDCSSVANGRRDEHFA